ncbi:MAG: hypothetical protein ACYC6N_24465 [Pirellulaceae bacterium]
MMKPLVFTLTAVVLACGAAFGQEEPGPNYERLKSFEHLIGTWECDGTLQEDVPNLGGKNSKLFVRISWGWILNKSALESNTIIELQGVKLLGKSLVGWDTSEGRIIGGKMNSLGGHDVSTVTYDDATKTWTTQSKGVDEKGRHTSATIVGRLIDADTYEWQMKDRKGGDIPGDSPKYIFKRIKQAK